MSDAANANASPIGIDDTVDDVSCLRMVADHLAEACPSIAREIDRAATWVDLAACHLLATRPGVEVPRSVERSTIRTSELLALLGSVTSTPRLAALGRAIESLADAVDASLRIERVVPGHEAYGGPQGGTEAPEYHQDWSIGQTRVPPAAAAEIAAAEAREVAPAGNVSDDRD
jgi:hypothetical protein